MSEISCIIIEDERPAQEVLRNYISRTDWLTLAGVFDDALSALDFLKRNDVDLIFLDIQLPALSGLEFLKVLKNAPQIIITTAFSEYAVEAFEFDVRDYLKKPFAFERFIKAVNRVSKPVDTLQLHQLQDSNSKLGSFAFFNVNKTMVKVMFEDILYVESMREYVYIHTVREKIITKISTQEIEQILKPAFLRIHRSFIVNLTKITAFNAEDVFIGTRVLPIGASYKSQVENIFKDHIVRDKRIN
jgi:two-component system, LytTR family, response regulator